MAAVLENSPGHSSADSSAVDLASADKNAAVLVFNEQTNYVPKRTIITVCVWPNGNEAIGALIAAFLYQIFLACSSVDLLALMDQTTLAASLSIIGNALGASDQTSWISGGYFVYVSPWKLDTVAR